MESASSLGFVVEGLSLMNENRRRRRNPPLSSDERVGDGFSVRSSEPPRPPNMGLMV